MSLDELPVELYVEIAVYVKGGPPLMRLALSCSSYNNIIKSEFERRHAKFVEGLEEYRRKGGWIYIPNDKFHQFITEHSGKEDVEHITVLLQCYALPYVTYINGNRLYSGINLVQHPLNAITNGKTHSWKHRYWLGDYHDNKSIVCSFRLSQCTRWTWDVSFGSKIFSVSLHGSADTNHELTLQWVWERRAQDGPVDVHEVGFHDRTRGIESEFDSCNLAWLAKGGTPDYVFSIHYRREPTPVVAL